MHYAVTNSSILAPRKQVRVVTTHRSGKETQKEDLKKDKHPASSDQADVQSKSKGNNGKDDGTKKDKSSNAQPYQKVVPFP